MNTPPPPLDDNDDPHAWLAQRDALRQLHREVLDEPVPASLLAAAGVENAPRGARAHGLRWGGMAAAVVVAFAAGWIGNAQWLRATADTPRLVRTVPAAQEFVHAAAVAHAVYSPEKRHPVEVAAAEQQHLIQWLSKRLDRPLKLPDLSAQGYTLVGGRLLPGSQGPRAQFMFEGAGGERVTLYVGSVDGVAAGRPDETAFRFATEGPVPSFYWIDHGFGYALAGALSRDALLGLATTVYRQLESAGG